MKTLRVIELQPRREVQKRLTYEGKQLILTVRDQQAVEDCLLLMVRSEAKAIADNVTPPVTKIDRRIRDALICTNVLPPEQ